jgi:hypothetical protein
MMLFVTFLLLCVVRVGLTASKINPCHQAGVAAWR